jgi:hypothetical protein
MIPRLLQSHSCRYSIVVQSQCFSYGGTDREISWLVLELMHITARLATYLAVSTQSEHLLSLTILFTTRRLEELH